MLCFLLQLYVLDCKFGLYWCLLAHGLQHTQRPLLVFGFYVLCFAHNFEFYMPVYNSKTMTGTKQIRFESQYEIDRQNNDKLHQGFSWESPATHTLFWLALSKLQKSKKTHLQAKTRNLQIQILNLQFFFLLTQCDHSTKNLFYLFSKVYAIACYTNDPCCWFCICFKKSWGLWGADEWILH